METPKRKKGGKKRPQIKRPSLHSYAIRPDLFAGLLHVPIPTPQFTSSPAIAPIPQRQKSLGELFSELVWEVAKAAWKQTDPASYKFNQAMFELAPYWPPESRWLLGVGAVGSAIYGLGQVADRAEKAIERETKRG